MNREFSAVAVYLLSFQGTNTNNSFDCIVHASWAPRTVEAIVHRAPLVVRTHVRGPLALFPVSFRLVLERPVTRAKRGQLVSIPTLSSLALVLEDTTLRFRATLIGEISGDHAHLIGNVKQGDEYRITIRKVEALEHGENS